MHISHKPHPPAAIIKSIFTCLGQYFFYIKQCHCGVFTKYTSIYNYVVSHLLISGMATDEYRNRRCRQYPPPRSLTP